MPPPPPLLLLLVLPLLLLLLLLLLLVLLLPQLWLLLSVAGLRAELLVGGTDARPTVRALAEGVDIVTGTPGRVMDLVESGKLPLDAVRFFVLDEADR